MVVVNELGAPFIYLIKQRVRHEKVIATMILCDTQKLIYVLTIGE